MAAVRIGVSLGMTIQVKGVDYVKPSVWAECDFDEMPSDELIKERFSWLWEKQIAPQAEEMLELMTKKTRDAVGEFRN